MKSQILFITTTNLSTNPRLLKEIKLALNSGYRADLIAFRLGNWSDGTEHDHLVELKGLNAFYLSAIKKPFFNWLVSTIIWKSSTLFYSVLKRSVLLNAYAHNKRSWQISRYLKANRRKYSLIIAHNPGALYPAYLFANRHHIPFAFDIEDYHPGEKCSPAEKSRREFLMQKLLPHAAFITYASPLIGKYSLDLLESSKIPENILINNCFPEDEFEYRENNSPKIKFVWFSQNISAGRGLEVLVPALAKYKEQVELTLIGNLYPAFYNEFLAQYTDFIHIDKPLLQKDLNQKLSEFDVGLAIELKTSDFNRDICLTNKIFSYAQSGLFILATDTTAQKDFISTHGMLGIITGQSAKEMEVQIEEIIRTIHTIRNQKKERFDYAKKLSWENESEKLKELWNKFIVVP